MQTELKQVNYQLKFDPKNTVLLQQKQKLLAESVTNTKYKLQSLKEAEKQAQVQFAKGEISEQQYRNLQREVIKTESQLKNLEKQAKASNVTLNKVSQSADKLAKSSKKVGTAMAPATVAIVGVGAAAFKMGSDFIESTNKVDVAFGESAKSVKKWSKTTLEAFGIAEGTALDLASGYGDMATSMGLPQEAAATMSEKLTGLAGDLASFKNIGIDQANTALTAVFTGETESLKKLGIVMTQVNLQEYAASQGIKTKIKDMSQSEQVQLRYNYVMEKTKNAQGDFARTSDGAANSTRVATESVKEASATIGIMLAPIVAKAAQYIANLAKKFANLDDGTKKIILVVLGLIAVISPMAFLISGIAAIVGVATGVTMGLGAAFTFLTSPIGLVILAIVAVIAIGVLLYKNWDKIKVYALYLFTSLVATFLSIKNGISQKINELKTNVDNTFNRIKYAITDKINAIKSTVSSVFNTIKNDMTRPFDSAKNTIQRAINRIRGFLNFHWSLPKLKVPQVHVRGKFSLSPPQVPKFSWYDKGGIFNSPSVIGIAEKRPEFVGALDDLKSIFVDAMNENKGTGLQVNFNGSYSFADRKDIDYFMNQSALLIKRRMA